MVSKESTRRQKANPTKDSKRTAPRRRTKKDGPSAATTTSGFKEKEQPATSPSSKKSTILALLKRRNGAGLKELIRATGWQPHSVRGFLSGVVFKKMGLKVLSFKTESGERRYSVEP